MDVQELEVPKEEARKELKNLKKGIKEGYISKRQKLTNQLFSIYAHLQHGGKLIDIPSSFSKAGLKKHLPKLGIVPVNAKMCYLYTLRNGGAIFSGERKTRWEKNARGSDVTLPPDTFEWRDLETDRYQTLAPIIPPRIHVEIEARLVPENYHILYEVEEWSKSAPPRDPILGKMFTKNIFGILATWDLTPLERTIIAGRI